MYLNFNVYRSVYPSSFLFLLLSDLSWPLGKAWRVDTVSPSLWFNQWSRGTSAHQTHPSRWPWKTCLFSANSTNKTKLNRSRIIQHRGVLSHFQDPTNQVLTNATVYRNVWTRLKTVAFDTQRRHGLSESYFNLKQTWTMSEETGSFSAAFFSLQGQTFIRTEQKGTLAQSQDLNWPNNRSNHFIPVSSDNPNLFPASSNSDDYTALPHHSTET